MAWAPAPNHMRRRREQRAEPFVWHAPGWFDADEGAMRRNAAWPPCSWKGAWGAGEGEGGRAQHAAGESGGDDTAMFKQIAQFEKGKMR